jgi:hypothetical protein
MVYKKITKNVLVAMGLFGLDWSKFYPTGISEFYIQIR